MIRPIGKENSMKTILLAVACCLWGLPSVAFASATKCEATGYGEGNAVACGGQATKCEATGYGPGNDVACGGDGGE